MGTEVARLVLSGMAEHQVIPWAWKHKPEWLGRVQQQMIHMPWQDRNKQFHQSVHKRGIFTITLQLFQRKSCLNSVQSNLATLSFIFALFLQYNISLKKYFQLNFLMWALLPSLTEAICHSAHLLLLKLMKLTPEVTSEVS